MPLDLSSLEKALDALETLAAKTEDESVVSPLDATIRNGLKSGVIQHFEFTYELCWKLLKRWLQENVNPSGMLGITHRELFRYGAENGLIDDPADWWHFHESRNRTSHTYNEDVADDVYETAVAFIPHARLLFKNLSSHND